MVGDNDGQYQIRVDTQDTEHSTGHHQGMDNCTVVTPLKYTDRNTRHIAGFPGSAHSACIFRNDDERFGAVVPFILSGLDRGDKCIYVFDSTSEDEVLNALMKERNVQKEMDEDNLTFIGKDQTYLKDGCFDADRMLRFVQESSERAIAGGYAGLTATGEMSWHRANAPGTDQLMVYEARLNGCFASNTPTLMCQYDESIFDHSILMDAVSTHPWLILKGELCTNPYYTPTNEFLSSRDGVIPKKAYDRVCRDVVRRARLSMIHRMELRDLRQMRTRLRALENSGLGDINSMIEVAGFYADMVRGSCSDSTTLSHLDVVTERCKDAQKRIRFLRAYLSIGQSEPEWQELGGLIDQTCAEVDCRLASMGLNIAGIEILADRLFGEALFAMLSDLLGTRGQPRQIRLDSHRVEDDLVISFEHADGGVPEPIKDSLFQLEQAHGRSDGFSLFLAAEILSSMGMKVRENGIAGKSTKFEIQIPPRRYRVAGAQKSSTR